MANLTDADKVLRNDTGKDIVDKLDDIATAIAQGGGGGGSSTFEGLSDVDIDDQTLTNGQVPKYNSSTQKWENGDVSLVGSIDDLNDVDTSGKTVGDSLRYDGNEWIAKPTTIEMTQAEYNAIVDFTPYANTNIVITDAPNLNPTASDIEYSSGVTVKQAIDNCKIYREYWSGTTSASGNVTPSNFDYTNNVVLAVTCRDKVNTNTHYLAILWGGTGLIDGTNTFNIRKITDMTAVSNTQVEGYFWYAKFESA